MLKLEEQQFLGEGSGVLSQVQHRDPHKLESSFTFGVPEQWELSYEHLSNMSKVDPWF